MTTSDRRAALVAALPDDVDAVLVTQLVNVRYLTGFTGSNGQLLLAAESAVFLTDSRYTEQSRHEVPDAERVTYSAFPAAFADACASMGAKRVGFESGGVTYRLYRELGEADGFQLVPTDGEVERLRWAKEPEELEMIGQHDDQSLVRVTCAHCKDTRMIAVAIATEVEPQTPLVDHRDQPSDDLGAAISADDVLDARLALTTFQGDLNSLLR